MPKISQSKKKQRVCILILVNKLGFYIKTLFINYLSIANSAILRRKGKNTSGKKQNLAKRKKNTF